LVDCSAEVDYVRIVVAKWRMLFADVYHALSGLPVCDAADVPEFTCAR
jgi:hypothetical protein